MREKMTPGFYYKKNELFCEGIPISKIAQKFGTPSYVYSKNTISNQVQEFKKSLPSYCGIFYAVKANSNIHILKLLHKLGCGMDIVSAGELYRAHEAHVPASKVVFSGVGKSNEELAIAIQAQIGCINIESVSEAIRIEGLARQLRRTITGSLRINPDIDAKTHPYISTGLKENKFGLSKSEVAEILHLHANGQFQNLQLKGISCHIGSQITAAKPFEDAWTKILTIAQSMPFPLFHLNLGGGLGIPYSKSEVALTPLQFGKLMHKVFDGKLPKDCKLFIEPGRSLVGAAGQLLTSVVAIKKRSDKRVFCIIDAGMNDLIRPALYGANHEVLPAQISRKGATTAVSIVGPICETADTFHSKIKFSLPEEGHLLSFANAGAYGMSMASRYNSRPLPPEVLVDGQKMTLIRKRESFADLVNKESI